MRTTLIVNPYASRVTPELAEAVARALGAEKTIFTERAGHAVELTRGAKTDTVVVFSGDGGFNEALNGARPETALGFVPGGSTSVLPRALGLPRDPLAAARALAAGRTRRISLGRANGRRFGFAAGVGLDAELIRRMDARGRREDGRRPGDLVFAWTVVRTLAERRVEAQGTAEPHSRSSRTPTRTPMSAGCRFGFHAGPGSTAGSTCSHLDRCACAGFPERFATSSSGGPACRSSCCTTATASRCAATARCRSSSTARTSAT